MIALHVPRATRARLAVVALVPALFLGCHWADDGTGLTFDGTMLLTTVADAPAFDIVDPRTGKHVDATGSIVLTRQGTFTLNELWSGTNAQGNIVAVYQALLDGHYTAKGSRVVLSYATATGLAPDTAEIVGRGLLVHRKSLPAAGYRTDAYFAPSELSPGGLAP